MRSLTRRTLLSVGVALLAASTAVAKKLGYTDYTLPLPPGSYRHPSFGPRMLVVSLTGRHWERI